MSYIKNEWAIYNPDLPDEEQEAAFITKAKLDNIETGIEEAHKLAEASSGDVELTIGEVVSGEEAAAEIIEGKLNLTLPVGPAGESGEKGDPGEKGYTPIKGTDYFTEEDKLEIRDAVIATRKSVPYFNEEANVVAACGVHINVDAASEAGKLRIHWFDDNLNNAQELIVPEGVKIAGGGVSADVVEYYPATSITLNSGYVDAVIGGCFGNGIVGHATIIVNGGTFKDTYVSGGGMHWAAKSAHKNKVGHAEVIINGTGDGEIEVVYCGTMSGVCSTGHGTVTVNNGNIHWLSGGGSNGYTSISEIVVNGGEIKILQGCNRGIVGNVKTTINGGKVAKLYAGGESGDASVNAVYDKVELFINGGEIGLLGSGTNGGVEDASKVSGKFVDGVITDDVAQAVNLVKTYTVEALMAKIEAMNA